ncbi:hypothetical protein KC19_3G022900 [Ceratodon purpureus]|uniref:Uncharacterized protein n=1 Tax=Ceratodon purpureus TaxID=3225 RepID=A0A8T0IDY3_CERPU|nr:hypothetical protein KC19_3G022900 [Ceratodon purpureus]
MQFMLVKIAFCFINLAKLEINSNDSGTRNQHRGDDGKYGSSTSLLMDLR